MPFRTIDPFQEILSVVLSVRALDAFVPIPFHTVANLVSNLKKNFFPIRILVNGVKN